MMPRLFAAIIVCVTAAALIAQAAAMPEAIGRPAAWHAPRVEDVRGEVFAWLAAKKTDAATHSRVEAIWKDAPQQVTEDELLLRLAETFAVVDPRAEKLVAL